MNDKIITFPVSLSASQIDFITSINTFFYTDQSKEYLASQALKFDSEGNYLLALNFYKTFLDKGFKDLKILCSYAILLKKFSKLRDAESVIRQTMEK